MKLAATALQVARIVTDVLDGKVTAATTTTITDTVRLIQGNQHWEKGILWIRSGEHAGKVLHVKGSGANKLTFDEITPAPEVGDRFSVARAVYPWDVLVSNGIQSALDETFVVRTIVDINGDPDPFTGDGETLEFDLPTGVNDLVAVTLEDPATELHRYPSTHYSEDKLERKLRFSRGFAPIEGYIIRPYYKTLHEDLENPDDEIDPEISSEWLRWKAAEYVLYWGVSTYGSQAEYRIEERLNRVLNKQKGLAPRMPIFRIKTAG